MAAFSENAVTVLRARYLKDGETPEERFRTVAEHVADGDTALAEDFYRVMMARDFLPNTPTIANAGRSLGQLNACFVLPMDDALTTPEGSGILDVARATGLIHQTGGGTGFDFSRLRPAGSPVRTSNGVASGPVSFIQMIDAVTAAIKQGGIRRGANMAELRIDHPDILEFIAAKTTENALTNFNISVSVTDEFMEAVAADKDFDLRWGGKVFRTLKARWLWEQIWSSAWRFGDPGVVFIDRMNRDNPLYPEYVIEATNPCGEVPLLPWEACTLGSINLGNFVLANGMDYGRLRQTVRLGITFLDNVVTVNKSPVPQIDFMTRQTRRLGLGVMGWADTLNQLRIPYDTETAVEFAEELSLRIREWADERSRELAAGRGAYPLSPDGVYRNIARLSIAPTGSISTIADCSAGIEPYFDRVVTRRLAIGTIKEAYKDADKPWFRTAMEIAPIWHVRMQAAWQKGIDNAVSKSVNLPNSASPEGVRDIYEAAYATGCKGITVYRDGSRDVQVYNSVIATTETPQGDIPDELACILGPDGHCNT